MILTYIKLALRNLHRNRLFAIINILGLSLGLAVCLYVATLIRHETGFDRHTPDSDRIFRLVATISNADNRFREGAIWGPVGYEMKGEIPGVQTICRVSGKRSFKLMGDDRALKLEDIRYADPEIFDLFGYHFLRGSATGSLSDPGSLVLTQLMAHELFGDEDPIGKSFSTSNGQVYTVSGIIENPPTNTHIPFSGLLSYKTAEQDPEIFIGWDGGLTFLTYLKVDKGVDPHSVESLFPAYLQHRINDKWADAGWKYDLKLQPLSKIHLSTDIEDQAAETRSSTYLVILGSIALIILLLAVINYINLTSALAGRRVRETSINKVLGANPKKIAGQVLVESLLTTLFAGLLAVIWIKTFTPMFNQLTTAHFFLSDYSVFISMIMILLIILTGLISGSAPAGILAKIRMTGNRQGLGTGGQRSGIRNGLVVIQFLAAIILLSCFFMVNRQSKFLVNEDVGYHKDDIVSLFSDRGLPVDEARRVKEELLKIPEIQSVSMASEMPGQGLTSNGYRLEGQENFNLIHVIYTDQDFLKCFGLELEEGRNFYEALENDRFSFLVNRALVSFAGWEDPIGRKIIRNGEHQVIGVVKDFHFASLQSPVMPLIISCNPRNDSWDYYNFNIRFETPEKQLLITKMEDVWRNNLPGVVFEYRFMSDQLKQNYVTIGQMQKIVSIFSLLAVIIAIIGLFGLSAFITQSRSREIGVRKVNGAESFELLILLNYQMVRWVLASMVLAIPVAIILINQWLAWFASRATISAGIFILAGGIAILLAIFTVSWESWRAARRSPVDVLKYE